MPFGYTVVKKSNLQPEDAYAEARRMAAISGLPNFELAVAIARHQHMAAQPQPPKPSAMEKVKTTAACVKQRCTVEPRFEYSFQSPVTVKVEVRNPVKMAWIKK